jgi:hypothetical protein
MDKQEGAKLLGAAFHDALREMRVIQTMPPANDEAAVTAYFEAVAWRTLRRLREAEGVVLVRRFVTPELPVT